MLYITRHGQTEWNRIRRYQGMTDIPLNETGIEQAKIAHDQILDIHFDICYCSPLSRAKDTAQMMLQGRNIPIVVDDRIHEINFGEYEGVYVSPDENDPMTILFNHPEKFVPGVGGESIEDVLARTKSFLEECIYPYKDKDILIVGHGGVDAAILSNIYNFSIEDYWKIFVKNCELRKIEY